MSDSDGDGIPDMMETYFGLDPNNSTDADADPFGLGWTQRERYLTGQDLRSPQDPWAGFWNALAAGALESSVSQSILYSGWSEGDEPYTDYYDETGGQTGSAVNYETALADYLLYKSQLPMEATITSDVPPYEVAINWVWSFDHIEPQAEQTLTAEGSNASATDAEAAYQNAIQEISNQGGTVLSSTPPASNQEGEPFVWSISYTLPQTGQTQRYEGTTFGLWAQAQAAFEAAKAARQDISNESPPQPANPGDHRFAWSVTYTVERSYYHPGEFTSYHTYTLSDPTGTWSEVLSQETIRSMLESGTSGQLDLLSALSGTPLLGSSGREGWNPGHSLLLSREAVGDWTTVSNSDPDLAAIFLPQATVTTFWLDREDISSTEAKAVPIEKTYLLLKEQQTLNPADGTTSTEVLGTPEVVKLRIAPGDIISRHGTGRGEGGVVHLIALPTQDYNVKIVERLVGLQLEVVPGDEAIVSADDHSIDITAEVYSDELEIMEAEVQWRVVRGSGSVSPATSSLSLDEPEATTTLVTGTQAGAELEVEAVLKSITLGEEDEPEEWQTFQLNAVSGKRSGIITVGPGQASAMTSRITEVVGPGGDQAMWPDGTSKRRVQVELRDSFGNPVAEGTSVNWKMLSGDGHVVQSDLETNAAGQASAMVRSGRIGGLPAALAVQSDALSETVEFARPSA